MIATLQTWGPVRVYLRDWTYFSFVWKAAVLGSIIQPLMFLLGVGLGVGALVDQGPGGAAVLGDTSYFAFYATALIATTSMFVLGQEALWPTMDGFTWSNAYRAMIATPLTPRDVALGKCLHYTVRGLMTSGGVAAVLLLFDETRTWGLLLAIPCGVLTGLSFAMPFAAWTASRDTDISFPAIIRFGLIPMFLFGGAFYPIEQLPDWLEPVVWITPLWHGVELCRGAVLGGLGIGRAFLHLGFLLAFVGAGTAASIVSFGRRLRP